MKTRLGLDIGTNSIGWWLYGLSGGHPARVIDGGVRIFTDGRDPQSGSSLAVDRRAARAARRRRDRYLRRRAALMRKLAAAGLMPADPAEQRALVVLDPYALRARGLDEKLSLTEFGRALFHLNQRRGFKSNRKTDRGDNEAGKIAQGTARLDQAMLAAGARTYGEFLHRRRTTAEDPRHTPPVRTRLSLHHDPDSGKDVTAYDFYPGRAHLEEEFAKLWDAQRPHHPECLTGALRAALFETIFHQRPLKDPAVGRCLYFEEPRLPKAHPLYQQRVLYETVNALKIRAPGRPDRPLSLEQRDTLILKLNSKTTKTLSSANVSFIQLGKVLGLRPDERFSHDTDNRKGLDCDALRAIFAHKDRFGPEWVSLGIDRQWELVRRLRDTEDPDTLFAWLEAEHGLSGDRARAVANAPLPQGYGRVGETATRALLDRLKAAVVTQSEAAEQALGSKSDFHSGDAVKSLPYYGVILNRHVLPGTNDPNDADVERYGRITNPTVHIGLTQLRHLVNRIIDTHGLPDEIVVELARDLKLNEDQKRQVNARIKRDTEAAKARGRRLEEDELGQPNTGENRLRLRLWEELNPDPLDRRCIYSGEKISPTMLFSGLCEVDHILPYSRTLDDSIANRILCRREANRGKANQSPWEAWGGTARWDTIAPLITRLPENKRWRFAPDAMTRFEDERDFAERQLVDTQYLSRISREYLSRLYPPDKRHNVWVVTGKMTEMLRRHWGLNTLLPDHNLTRTAKKKNRLDHRHHAIDAAVIGATDRGLLNLISREAGRREAQGLEDVVARIDPPFHGFRDAVKTQLERITVSHRADHGRIDAKGRKAGCDSTAARLHNDTAYGLTDQRSGTGVAMVTTRKPLAGLKPDDLPKIRDEDLKAALTAVTDGLADKDRAAALAAFSAGPGPYRGIRRVRLLVPQKVIEIAGTNGRPYKGYKGDSNHCYEVWRMPDGAWKAVVYTTFEAHQPGLDKKPHPAAKRLMRLHKNDMLALTHPKHGSMIAVIATLSEQRLELHPHTESNADKRNRDKDDPFSFLRVSASTLQKSGARRVFVDEIGRVRDAGPHDSRR